MDPEVAITLRAKKLGILIKDARSIAGKTLKECGEAVGVSGSTISSYERGNSSPSLPELEMLSYFLGVPIQRFWKEIILSNEETLLDQLEIEHALVIRNRQIGSILQNARENLDLTYEEITEKTGITYGRMKRFETGDSPVPLPELELLSNELGITMGEFFESETEIGKWITSQESISKFAELPVELQAFVTKPVNIPYLEIAQKLSHFSADQLRTIAENLLEITI
jgi:transcriptional regulator with XRE-family HTH domain